MVATNHKGELVEAISRCRQGTISSNVAMAIRIREALSWIKQKKWRSVEVESDYLVAIQSIRCSTALCSYFGRVIEKCKQLLNGLNDRDTSLSFVKRSANNLAHYLVRYNCSIYR